MKTIRTTVASAIAAALLFAGASTARAEGNYTLGWGGNDDGQLTFNTNALTRATMIAAGAYHSLAVVDGRIYGWGCGDGGALDYDASIRNIDFVAAGENSGLAIRNDGVAVFWGGTHNYDFRTQFAQVAASDTFSAAALGSDHGLLLARDGSVHAWGAPSNSMRAVSVPNGEWTSGFTAVAAGRTFSVGLSNGCVHVAAPLNDTLRIADVPAAAKSGVTAIAAGPYHAMALTEDGAVVAWGAWFDEASVASRAVPRASWGDVTNVPPAATSNIVAISAGDRTCAALTEDGEVVVWGMDESWGGILNQIPAYAQQDIHEISLGFRHILVRSAHLPPEFTGNTLPTAHLETEYTASIPLRADPDATVSVLDTRLLTPGLTLNPDGTFSGIPTAKGTNNFHVVASNAYGTVTQQFSIVTSDRVVQVPTFLTTELPEGIVGFPYFVQLEATEDPAFRVDGNLPAWASFSDDGTLSGTPTTVGTNYPTFTAYNSAGYANFSPTLAVKAQSADTPPIFGLDAIPDLPVGTPVSLDLCITGAYAVALSGKLADELSIQHSGDRWILAGTPTVQGNGLGAVVTASNDGATATKNYSVNVVGAPVWTTAETLPPATPGNAYTAIIAASFADNYTATGSLPPGLSLSLRLDGDDVVAVISGTLGETSAAAFSVPVTASNAHGSASRTFVIPVSSTPGDLAFTSIVASPKTSTVTLTWSSKSNPDAPTDAYLATSPDLSWPDGATIRTNSPATIPLPASPAYFRLVAP